MSEYRCPYCHGTDNHAADFDCRTQQNRQSLVDRLLTLEQYVANLQARVLELEANRYSKGQP